MRKASPSPDPKDKNKEVHYDNSPGLKKSAIHLGQVDIPCMQVTFINFVLTGQIGPGKLSVILIRKE